ncbi:cell wall hydrolase [Sphingomonas sp. ID0503]|uniref:cell wall hydrolase n=1 Tax=Sphingomonas sp. ID0503 TaxID=3399691 RepID=UPI003AFA5F72
MLARERLWPLLLVLLVAGFTLAAWAARELPAPLATHAPALAEEAVPPPNAPPPPVEPVENVAVAPDQARLINASVPFSTRPNPAARAYRFAGSDQDKARATDCLAAAAYYEAVGEGVAGMRAVAQVVLNRLRHPAFPKTVCGVVFEGAERVTGCQFTFTCDGSLARAPSAAGWKKAEEVARDALKGKVDKGVGWSTHYHTNWVVPSWAGSLDKTAGVGTHLFYRWLGWWGTAGAFRGGYAGNEPAQAKIAKYAASHADAAAPVDPALAALTGTPGTTPVAASKPRDVYPLGQGQLDPIIVILDPTASPDSYAAMALSICGDKSYCKLLAWRDARRAPGLPPVEPSHLATMSFSYLRDRPAKYEKALWNCKEMPRPDAFQCMKG